MKKNLVQRVQQLTLLAGISSIMALTGCQTKLGKNTLKALETAHIDVIVVDAQSYEFLRNVSCTFSDNDHNSYTFKTNPGAVTIEYVSRKLYLSCEAPNYYQTQIAIANNLNNWSYSGLTILPGYVIDAAEFPPPLYPTNLIVFMDHTPLRSTTNAERHFDEDQKKEVFFQGTQSVK